MPPKREKIVRLFVRRALLLITLIIVIALPCFSPRQTRFVKSASLPDSVLALSFQNDMEPKTQPWVNKEVCVSTAWKPSYSPCASIHD